MAVLLANPNLGFVFYLQEPNNQEQFHSNLRRRRKGASGKNLNDSGKKQHLQLE